MQFSGTFLKSKVAQRIALLLLIAAVIPALLITWLTYRNVGQLSSEHSQHTLKTTSQNYALLAFNNLLTARKFLQHTTQSYHHENSHAEEIWQHAKSIAMFNAIVEISAEGKIISQHGQYQALVAALKQQGQGIVNSTTHEKTRLIVFAATQAQQSAHVGLAIPSFEQGQLHSLLVAELNPDFLWGLKSNYSSEQQICAYRVTDSSKTTLFCSSDATDKARLNSQKGAWDLFLKAELDDAPWTFETTQFTPAAKSGLWALIGSNDYIGVGLLSLLVVGLLSLIQIRRTMIPLERLIDGTRKISQGEFASVEVDGKSEFSELATAFNNMSGNIKRQLDTLQSLSEVDRKIVTKLDIDHLIDQVMARILYLKPDASACIFRIVDKNATEVQCIVDIANQTHASSRRKSITLQESSYIASLNDGSMLTCEPQSLFEHQQLMASLGANAIWLLPIFWQGEMCAFLLLGSQQKLDENDSDLHEIRDLASRIGIVMSAQKREAQLLMQAHYDILTGLPNRILLEDRIGQAIELSDRTKLPMWVVFLDLDRFKFINDSMGHNIGDQLLVQVANRMQAAVREVDTVARFGGDEFIIVLPGQADETLMMGVLERMIAAVCQPMQINSLEIIVTCSIGIAVYPNDGANAETLIQRADIAMYRAKELGKNNFQFFTESMNEKVAERMYMENLLRHALAKNELEVHYQPKVDLETMQIVGMEALIRWNSPELGFISPLRFISLAEETGLIVPIGEWVMRTACAQTVAWQKAGFAPILMSVNLSARQFKQSNLIERIKNILKETGLDAQYLELELTESLVMTEVESSLKLLHEIKALGIQISVDDFGTGYSSLSYLKDLPLNTLKIDKSFTDDIVNHTDKAPIVQAVISLAKSLNLKIVAEGVESFEQVLYLQQHACDQMQGYYFSRPKPAVDIEKLLIEAQAATSKKIAHA
ncbi:MAG TPA: EAL domain-containing protein [Methylotenera sp.]|nr:EAL domain-containing protein [Methylotenera sp.]